MSFKDYKSSLGEPGNGSVQDMFPHLRESMSAHTANDDSDIEKGSDTEDHVNFYGQREKNDRRIVLVGRTGSGKSATGNTLLNKKEFVSKASSGSITQNCEQGLSHVSGKRLVVIDTPGLFDTKLPHGEVTREIIRCIHMSAPGPHVFLMVLRLDRFTQEEIDTFNCLFDIFGEQMGEYAIILFTRLDDLEVDGTTLAEFLESSPGSLKAFIQKVNKRYIGFNNRASEEQNSLQVNHLIKMVESIVNKNNGKCYTNALYKEAEANLRRRIREVEKAKAEEKQREVAKIEEKFKDQIEEAKNSNQSLQKQIKQQMDDKRKLDEQQQQAQHVVHNLVTEMKKINIEHEKELFEVKQDQKTKAEQRIREFQLREQKIDSISTALTNQIQETERKIRDMEDKKNQELRNMAKTFDARMKESVQEIVHLKTAEIAHLQKQYDESISINKKLLQQNEMLFEKLQGNDKLMEDLSENNKKQTEYIGSMIEQVHHLERQLYDDTNRKEKSFFSCSIS